MFHTTTHGNDDEVVVGSVVVTASPVALAGPDTVAMSQNPTADVSNSPTPCTCQLNTVPPLCVVSRRSPDRETHEAHQSHGDEPRG